jgi:small nuclear ribonucleoprotein (snRNP)-like protein
LKKISGSGGSLFPNEPVFSFFRGVKAGCPGAACSNGARWKETLKMFNHHFRKMVNSIVLPIKKVFALVDSKIIVEIKDDNRKLHGRLVAVDEHLNIHMDHTIEYIDEQRGRSLGTVVIRGSNILTIAPAI